MLVGTCSGVTFAGMVISSALGGTSSGNSSLTNERIRDVLPTPGSPTNNMRTFFRCDVPTMVEEETIMICVVVVVVFVLLDYQDNEEWKKKNKQTKNPITTCVFI